MGSDDCWKLTLPVQRKTSSQTSLLQNDTGKQFCLVFFRSRNAFLGSCPQRLWPSTSRKPGSSVRNTAGCTSMFLPGDRTRRQWWPEGQRMPSRFPGELQAQAGGRQDCPAGRERHSLREVFRRQSLFLCILFYDSPEEGTLLMSWPISFKKFYQSWS